MVNRRRIIMISNSSQTIHGTWEDLFHAIDTKTYTTKYQIGEIIPLKFGSVGTLDMQIVAFNDGVLSSDHNDRAAVTFMSKGLYPVQRRFNPATESGVSGTGIIGGWPDSELRSYFVNDIYPIIQADVKQRIAQVYISSSGKNTGGSNETFYSDDYIYLANPTKSAYSSIFPDAASRAKNDPDGTTRSYYFRNIYGNNVRIVQTTGALGSSTSQTVKYFAIEFCVN